MTTISSGTSASSAKKGKVTKKAKKATATKTPESVKKTKLCRNSATRKSIAKHRDAAAAAVSTTAPQPRPHRGAGATAMTASARAKITTRHVADAHGNGAPVQAAERTAPMLHKKTARKVVWTRGGPCLAAIAATAEAKTADTALSESRGAHLATTEDTEAARPMAAFELLLEKQHEEIMALRALVEQNRKEFKEAVESLQVEFAKEETEELAAACAAAEATFDKVYRLEGEWLALVDVESLAAAEAAIAAGAAELDQFLRGKNHKATP